MAESCAETSSGVGAALAECRRLATEPAPDLPMLVSLGSHELVVSGPAIRHRAASWPAGRLLEVPGAHHEVMFEAPEMQQPFFAAFAGLLSGR